MDILPGLISILTLKKAPNWGWVVWGNVAGLVVALGIFWVAASATCSAFPLVLDTLARIGFIYKTVYGLWILSLFMLIPFAVEAVFSKGLPDESPYRAWIRKLAPLIVFVLVWALLARLDYARSFH